MIDRQRRNRKDKRNRQLVRYIKGHPGMTLKEVGVLFKLSKQRVSKIIKDYGGKDSG